MLAFFTGLTLWWRIGVIVGIVLIFVGAIYAVYHSVYTKGFQAAESKYKPQIQKLEQDLKNSQQDLESAAKVNRTFSEENSRLAALLRTQSMELDKLEAAKITAQNEARAALARVVANQKRYSAEIARLQSIVNGPPMTEGDSEEADSILRSILRDRMSVHTGAETDRDSATRASGDGEGGSRAALHRQIELAFSAATNEDRFEESQQSAGSGSGGARLASSR